MRSANRINTQFARNLLAGSVGTAAHFLVLFGLVKVVNVKPLIATSAGFVVGALINYCLNYRYTFASQKTHREAMWRFLVVAVAGAGINAVVFSIAKTQFHYLVAQVFATAFVVISTYAANRLWTFDSCR